MIKSRGQESNNAGVSLHSCECWLPLVVVASAAVVVVHSIYPGDY